MLIVFDAYGDLPSRSVNLCALQASATPRNGVTDQRNPIGGQRNDKRNQGRYQIRVGRCFDVRWTRRKRPDISARHNNKDIYTCIQEGSPCCNGCGLCINVVLGKRRLVLPCVISPTVGLQRGLLGGEDV